MVALGHYIEKLHSAVLFHIIYLIMQISLESDITQ